MWLTFYENTKIQFIIQDEASPVDDALLNMEG